MFSLQNFLRIGLSLLAIVTIWFLLKIDRTQQRTNPISGAVEVFVPSGLFLAGVQENNRPGNLNSLPLSEIYLDAFWISKTQVTNAQYAVCFEAGACPDPLDPEDNPHFYDLEYADHPVVFISWYGAAAYCSWVGGRLPSEVEWEKAARGTDGQSYAWGEDDDARQYARVGLDAELDTTAAVGSYPQGASPYGALDMGGNVREWVADWFAADLVPEPINPQGPEEGEERVLRGAAWYDPALRSLAFGRQAHAPGSPGAGRGFRCAFSE